MPQGGLQVPLSAILRCPRCSARFETIICHQLICGGCASTYDVENGVPILWGYGSRASKLEDIDYDKIHAVNPATIRETGLQWKEVLKKTCDEAGDMLELGAGTGILTEGLMDHTAVRSIVATDVSRKFMFGLSAKLSARSQFKGAVVCDANETVFGADSFDLVVGRSILHHLIDYPVVLKNAHMLLKSGGAAIFFEPLLEGKSIISLACAIILQSDKVGKTPTLTKTETAIIHRLLRHQTKHAWYPQTRAELSKLEDKYIFMIAELKAVGINAGYRQVDFIDRQILEPPANDPSYWSYIRKTLAMVGVDVGTSERFNWIGEAIRESYYCHTNRVPAPMGYFVFRK